VSPWDDLLTTPALDYDVGMTPDIYTSPLMDSGDDFDNKPSLFGGTAFEGYEPNEAVCSYLPPSGLNLRLTGNRHIHLLPAREGPEVALAPPPDKLQPTLSC
jgi:hypothetical protein